MPARSVFTSIRIDDPTIRIDTSERIRIDGDQYVSSGMIPAQKITTSVPSLSAITTARPAHKQITT